MVTWLEMNLKLLGHNIEQTELYGKVLTELIV